MDKVPEELVHGPRAHGLVHRKLDKVQQVDFKARCASQLAHISQVLQHVLQGRAQNLQPKITLGWEEKRGRRKWKKAEKRGGREE